MHTPNLPNRPRATDEPEPAVKAGESGATAARRRWARRARVAIALALTLAGAAVGATVFAERTMRAQARDRIVDHAEGVPSMRVALVLGTVRALANGRKNLYFEYRLDAAADLWRQGRVDLLLLSGDNSREGYDEPTDMRDGLLARGVPADAIVLDYAGFRTLDSVARLWSVFGQRQAIVISQRAHLERALFLCRAHGIDAWGLAAASPRPTRRQRLREALARVAAALDVYVLCTKPRFEGPEERLPSGIRATPAQITPNEVQTGYSVPGPS